MHTIFPIITEDTAKLPMYVTGIGTQINQEHIRRNNGFHCYHWALCTRGSGKLLIENKEYEIQEGTAFFFQPGIPHEYYATCEPWTVKWLIFDGSALQNLLSLLDYGMWKVFSLPNYHDIELAMNNIYLALQENCLYKHARCSSLLYSFLVETARQLYSDTRDMKAAKYRKLQPVISYMESNYNSDISLEAMAQIIGVTQSYLCRLFKHTYNLSPFRYLNRIRIQKAKELLLQSAQLSINDIALGTGFNSSSYFCATFKEIEGCTPAEFRQMHGSCSRSAVTAKF